MVESQSMIGDAVADSIWRSTDRGHHAHG